MAWKLCCRPICCLIQANQSLDKPITGSRRKRQAVRESEVSHKHRKRDRFCFPLGASCECDNFRQFSAFCLRVPVPLPPFPCPILGFIHSLSPQVPSDVELRRLGTGNWTERQNIWYPIVPDHFYGNDTIAEKARKFLSLGVAAHRSWLVAASTAEGLRVGLGAGQDLVRGWSGAGAEG